MGFITTRTARNLMRVQPIKGSNIRYMRGDGLFDWIKGVAKKILPTIGSILKPVLGIAQKTLLPAAVGAIQSGNTDGLKQAFRQTVKESLPGVLDRTSQAGLEQLQKYVPIQYAEQINPALANLAQTGQQFINQKAQQALAGEGLRKKKAREKKIQQLVSGSGLLKYN